MPTLRPKLVGLAGLALVDAINLRSMPGVEFAAAVGCFAMGGLLNQAAVGGMRHGLWLHDVHHDALELLPLDQAHLHRHVDGLCQQLIHAFLTQQPAQLHQRGGVARQTVLFAGQTREMLPAQGVAPALHHPFIRLFEGVLEVQQRNDDAQQQRGRPALETRTERTGTSPKRSRSGMATPARALRINR